MVLDASMKLEVGPRSQVVVPSEELWNRFADPTFAYRFGSRSFDYVVASWGPLQADGESSPRDLADAYGGFVFAVPGASHFPAPSLIGTLVEFSAVRCTVRVEAHSVSRFIHVAMRGFTSPVSMFDLGPGQVRTVELVRKQSRDSFQTGHEALKAESTIEIYSAGQRVNSVAFEDSATQGALEETP